jgi:AcrR family transcriptional regulator
MLARHKGKTRTVRDPQRTRELLLQSAFQEVYRSGFQSASVDNILASTGVTKGALYHHFDSKESLGYAVIDEVIAGMTRDKWLGPLASTADPIDTLIGIVEGTSVLPQDIRGGCPLNNLAQEMSPLDEGFRKRLGRQFDAWQEAIAAALSRGQSEGMVRRDLDARETAGFLIAMYEGYLSLAKNAQDANILEEGIRNITKWLRSLRIDHPSAKKAQGHKKGMPR